MMVGVGVIFYGQPVRWKSVDAEKGWVEVFVTDANGDPIRYPDGSVATVELRGRVQLSWQVDADP
jgi:hypothetical protein